MNTVQMHAKQANTTAKKISILALEENG